MFDLIERGTPPATNDSGITKRDLIGHLIVFSWTKYDPELATEFGHTPCVDADLLIVTGPHTGEEIIGWRTFGNMAKQMAKQAQNRPIIARVVEGKMDAGRTWIGIDVAVTEEDFSEAQAVNAQVRAAKRQPSPTSQPPKPPF
jgi:hypothetical protein